MSLPKVGIKKVHQISKSNIIKQLDQATYGAVEGKIYSEMPAGTNLGRVGGVGNLGAKNDHQHD